MSSQSFHYGDGSTAYAAIAQKILTCGARSAPRSLATRELHNVTVVIADASQAVPVDAGRKISTKIGVTEYSQLLAGVSSLAQLDAASNEAFSKFADDGRLRGAYGPRVYHQLPHAARLLQDDPDTRQAVVSVWRGHELETRLHDTPCTVALQFRRREKNLDLAVIMRSSDAWLGIPYDWWQFSRLQMTMAWAADLRPGTFTFFAGSLHLYENDFEKARMLHRGGNPDHAEMQPPCITHPWSGTTSASARIKEAQDVAAQVVFSLAQPPGWGAAWYQNRIPDIPREHEMCSRCRYITVCRLARDWEGVLCSECAREK